MKRKLTLALTGVFIVGICIVVGLRALHIGFAATSTTVSQCAGNAVTISATAPASVTTGSSFSVTNISSTTNVPAGITVNKIVSTSNVINASPTSISGVWTGTGAGTLTAHFPDVNLTATGAAGSQVKLVLSSIDLYINGSSSPITCGVANGQLTASGAGQSLTILTVGVTAPAPPPSPSGGGGSTSTGSAGSMSNSSTQAASPTPAKTTTPAAPTSAAAPSTASAQPSAAAATPASTPTTMQVKIAVKDSSAQPLSGAEVGIDSLPTELTDSNGYATFNQVAVGSHKITVTSENKSVVRTFQVDAKAASSVTLTVELPAQKPAALVMIGVPFSSIILIALIGLIIRHRLKRSQILAEHMLQPVAFEPRVPINTVVVSPAISPNEIDSQAPLQQAPPPPQIVAPDAQQPTLPAADPSNSQPPPQIIRPQAPEPDFKSRSNQSGSNLI